ncbi:MAG: hypothetical protein J5I53_00395, partial [Bradyrhizobiaceae bacterium]|nr:hypothetical protein [Bradyrhizobiaceae bacterium]
MTKAVLLVFALCISIPAFAQPLADTTSLDSLRSVVKQLQVQWQKQWRASDSLRITSILTRLRADSITRSIKTTEKAIADAQRRREAELQREAQRHLSEQDAADSIVPVSESAIESAQEQRDTSPPNQFPEQQGIEKPVDDGADGESNAATADDAADAATAEILQTLALQSAARTAAQKLQAGKPKRGETLSDSLTYHVLTMKPDTGIASYYASEFHGKRSSNG